MQATSSGRTMFSSRSAPCIRSAPGKFELTSQDSAGGKKFTILTSTRKGIEIRQLLSLEIALNLHEKEFTIPKTYHFVKSEKYQDFCVSKLLSWRRQKWVAVAGVRHGNSLVVRRVSPGRIIVVLFRTKYAVPRQIKPRILKLTIRRGQNNFSIVFIIKNWFMLSVRISSYGCSGKFGEYERSVRVHSRRSREQL